LGKNIARNTIKTIKTARYSRSKRIFMKKGDERPEATRSFMV